MERDRSNQGEDGYGVGGRGGKETFMRRCEAE